MTTRTPGENAPPPLITDDNGSAGTPSAYASPNKRPLIKDQLELVRRPEASGGSCKYEIKPIANTLTFDKGFFLCFRAIQMLKAADPDAVIVVGLAGPSGAGKTVFTEKTREFLPGCALLCMDMYNDGNLVVDGNFDDPRLTDYQTLLDNIQALKAGRSCQVPIYDFKQSRRVGYRTVETPANRVVLVEGIYALSDRLRPLLDLRVSVRGGVHLDLVKRVMRDVTRSGQAPEEIIQQISETVYPMYKAFIEPDLQTAHLKIVNTFNPFSGFQSPTYILKSSKHVTEEAVVAVLSDGAERLQEDGITDIYLVPPNEDQESCSGSWLRMRSRNGRYQLVFEEYMTDGPFIISPNIKFEVNVRILGGLMALGYTVATIMKRSCVQLKDDLVTVKLDTFEGLDRTYVQVQGRVRAAVEETARRLGLEGTFVPRSYIEQMQLEKASLQAPEMPAEVIIRTLQSANSLHKGSGGAEEEAHADLGGVVAVGASPRRAEDAAGAGAAASGAQAAQAQAAASLAAAAAAAVQGGGHAAALANGHASGGANGHVGNSAHLLLHLQGNGASPTASDGRASVGLLAGAPGVAIGPAAANGAFAGLGQYIPGTAYPSPLLPAPLTAHNRNNSYGAGLHGGFAPQLGGPAAGGGGISQNVSLGDLHANPWALPHPQLPLPLAVPGALEARFLELSSRLDHVVEMVSALAAQAQQLQQAQQLAAWHPAAGASEWGGAAPGGTPLVAHHHKPAEGDVTSVQKAYAARMDAIARSISSEAQSARDSVFWEAGPRGGAGGEGRAYGPYGGRPPAARLLSDGVAGGLAAAAVVGVVAGMVAVALRR